MITIDVGLIAALVGLLGTMIALLGKVVQLLRRLERLERHDKLDYEARGLMLGGLYAALNGILQLGTNGAVTQAEEQLKEFMFKR